MNDDSQKSEATEAQRFLAIYLRDHHAGSAAELGLVRRCRDSNAGTPVGNMLAQLGREIAEDRQTLEGAAHDSLQRYSR